MKSKKLCMNLKRFIACLLSVMIFTMVLCCPTINLSKGYSLFSIAANIEEITASIVEGQGVKYTYNLPIASAISSNPNIVKVTLSDDAHNVTLTGVEPGTAEVTILGGSGDGTLVRVSVLATQDGSKRFDVDNLNMQEGDILNLIVQGDPGDTIQVHVYYIDGNGNENSELAGGLGGMIIDETGKMDVSFTAPNDLDYVTVKVIYELSKPTLTASVDYKSPPKTTTTKSITTTTSTPTTKNTTTTSQSPISIVDSGECGAQGDNIIWTLDSEGTLIISGEGEMAEDMRFFDSPWTQNTDIKNVIIENGITEIGNSAFSFCDSLTSVIIPDSVTNIKSLAFASCNNLTSITIPDSVLNIEKYSFNGCDALASVSLSANLKSIGDYAFEHCKSLVSITISEGVKDIGTCAFKSCNSLTSIKIPDSVTSIGSFAFYDTPWLETQKNKNDFVIVNGILIDAQINDDYIVVPEGVTSIGEYAFSFSKINSIVIPEGVTTIGENAFLDCSNLVAVTIPDSITKIERCAFDGTQWLNIQRDKNPLVIVNDILIDGQTCVGDVVVPKGVKIVADQAFHNCSALTSVDIPDGVTNIGNRAFYECTGLTSIIIPDSLTNIGDRAFYNCSTLTSIKLPDDMIRIGEGAFINCSALTSITIPDSVISIGESAFLDCSDLTEVIISDGVKSIEDFAFYGCTSLPSITIPNSVSNIGYVAFNECKTLKEFRIAENNEYFTSVDGVLFDKNIEILLQYPIGKNEKTYIIPDSVTKILDASFSSSDNLTSVVIPDSVTSIGESAFSNCSVLTSITIKNSKCEIYDHASAISDTATIYGIKDSTAQAYAEKYDRKFIALDEPVTTTTITTTTRTTTSITQATTTTTQQVNTIVNSGECGTDGNNLTWTLDSEGTLIIRGEGNMADWYSSLAAPWYYYSNLIKTVIIESGVINIGNRAFLHCYALTDITIPDSVTSIGDFAFYGCNLTSITIPDSITSIGTYAFCGCHLTSVEILDGVISIGACAFVSCDSLKLINVDSENKYYASEGGVLFNKDKSILIQYPAGKTAEEYAIPDSVTSIENFAFDGCDALTSITIENPECEIYDSLYTISDTTTIYGFKGSTAEAYAEKYNRSFIALDESITTTTTTTTSSTTMTTTTATTTSTTTTTTYIVNINKVDIVGTQVVGARLELSGIDENGNTITFEKGSLTVDSYGEIINGVGETLVWISGEDTAVVIVENGTYTLHEEFAPDGYEIVNDIVFEVTEGMVTVDGKVVDSIVMIDGRVTTTTTSTTTTTITTTTTTTPQKYEDVFDIVLNPFGSKVYNTVADIIKVGVTDNSVVTNVVSEDKRTIAIVGANIGYSEVEVTLSNGDVYLVRVIVTSNGYLPPETTTTTTTTKLTTTTTQTTTATPTTSTTTTTTTTIETSVTTRTPKFVEGYDNWGFENKASVFSVYSKEEEKNIYYLEKTHRDALIEIVGRENNNIESDLIKNEIVTSRNNGSCFGLSLLAMYNCYNIISPSDLDGKSKYLQNVVLDDNIKSLINYHSLLQRTTTINRKIDDYYLKNTENKKIQDLIESLVNETPTLLCYTVPSEKFSHAVIAYGIEYGLYEFERTQVQYDAKILIYDCNRSDFKDTYCMYVNTERKEWYIPDRNLTQKNCGILWVQNNINELTQYSIFINDIPRKEDIILPSLETIDMGNISVKAVKKNSNNGDWFISSSDDEIYSYYGFMSGTGSSPLRYIMGDVNGNYLLKSEDNSLPAKLQMRYRDCLMRINSTTTDNIVFQPNGFEFTGVLSEYNIHMVLNNTPTQTSFHTIDVSGDSANKLIFKYHNGEWYMSGDMKNVVIQANNNDFTSNMLSFSIPSSYNKVCLRQIDERTIEAFVDIDNDGFYETRVDKIYEVTMGDVNEDGSVDSSDASLVLAEYAKIQTGGVGEFTDIHLKAADVNNDDVVDSSDASKILAYYAMISTGKEPAWD